MKRRDMMKVLPMAVAGYTGLSVSHAADAKKPLGLRYLSRVRGILKKIKATESEEMLEASYRMADTIKKGGNVYVVWDSGHSNNYDLWPERPGRPDFFSNQIPQDAGKGDLILTNGYNDNLKALHDRGAFLISGPRPWGADCLQSELIADRMQHMKIRPFADLWINLYATSYGAIMHVPGSPNPMGPVSGAVGMMTFWMMIADTARLLVADGKTFNVSGDTPRSSRSEENVNLNEPVGDDYFAVALKQLNAIEREFGTINNIAAMAVHAALNGGRVYVYSRHTENLCAEGTVRRGGLAMTLGISGPPDKLRLMEDPLRQGDRDPVFKPTNKDVVIMGIGKPDDPDDLAALDIFRNAGMGTAAIGPQTSNGEKPVNSILVKVDLYAGKMMDSSGLFAFPGIARKVAPTSGLVNNQIFWAVCCQIAEQLVERTGNAPVIFLSGALKGGLERLDSDKQLYIKRGY